MFYLSISFNVRVELFVLDKTMFVRYVKLNSLITIYEYRINKYDIDNSQGHQ